jgi:quercetin dioxygenase-like cupin family protein
MTTEFAATGMTSRSKGQSGMTLAWAIAAGVALAVPLSSASADDKHVMLTPEEIAWSPGPPSIPEGAESVVLYGNPGEDDLFALRLRLPEGYHLPPHTHPRPEVVTIISGTVHFGMGGEADRDNTQAFEPGSFIVFEPGTAHYLFADEEVVFQLNSTGPWALEYVNPEDDPRS